MRPWCFFHVTRFNAEVYIILYILKEIDHFEKFLVFYNPKIIFKLKSKNIWKSICHNFPTWQPAREIWYLGVIFADSAIRLPCCCVSHFAIDVITETEVCANHLFPSLIPWRLSHFFRLSFFVTRNLSHSSCVASESVKNLCAHYLLSLLITPFVCVLRSLALRSAPQQPSCSPSSTIIIPNKAHAQGSIASSSSIFAASKLSFFNHLVFGYNILCKNWYIFSINTFAWQHIQFYKFVNKC